MQAARMQCISLGAGLRGTARIEAVATQGVSASWTNGRQGRYASAIVDEKLADSLTVLVKVAIK
jgi:hypothetical protein